MRASRRFLAVRLAAAVFLLLCHLALLGAVLWMFWTFLVPPWETVQADFAAMQEGFAAMLDGFAGMWKEFRSQPADVQLTTVSGGCSGIAIAIYLLVKTRRYVRENAFRRAARMLCSWGAVSFTLSIAGILISLVPFMSVPGMILFMATTITWQSCLYILLFEGSRYFMERIGLRSQREPKSS
jgi:hypothetical protein